MSYESCAICHNVKNPIYNHCICFDKFEKSEWAKDFESEIRADAKRKCGEELLKVINEKPYGTEKNNWWLISQIRHFCFGVPRICDKEEHGNESTIYN